MKAKVATFLTVTLFSYFGDLLAGMSIPVMLFKKYGGLSESASFTLVVILATLVVSLPAAKVLRRHHPLMVIFVSDVISCALLLLLPVASEQLGLPEFLACCFLVALAINFPIFAKSQLLYKYFVEERLLAKASSVQAKLMGLTFVLSLLTVGGLFDRVGFRGVILIDVATYVPLLVVCWSWRKASPLGYEQSCVDHLEPLRTAQREATVPFYYVFNSCTFCLATIRNNLLLTVLLSVFSAMPLSHMSLWVGLGTVLSLTLDRFTTDRLAKSVERSTLSLCSISVAIGLLLQFGQGVFAIIAIGFAMTEMNAISLRTLRTKQTEMPPDYPVERMATLSTVSGSIAGLVSVPALLWAISHLGPGLAFACLAAEMAGAYFAFSNKRLLALVFAR